MTNWLSRNYRNVITLIWHQVWTYSAGHRWGLRITGELEVLMITKCVNTDGKFLPYGPTMCIPSPPAQWNTIWPPCTCRHEYQLVLLFVSITEWKMAILLVLSAFSAFSSLVSYDTITHLNTTLNNNELASFVWFSIY